MVESEWEVPGHGQCIKSRHLLSNGLNLRCWALRDIPSHCLSPWETFLATALWQSFRFPSIYRNNISITSYCFVITRTAGLPDFNSAVSQFLLSTREMFTKRKDSLRESPPKDRNEKTALGTSTRKGLASFCFLQMVQKELLAKKIVKLTVWNKKKFWKSSWRKSSLLTKNEPPHVQILSP